MKHKIISILFFLVMILPLSAFAQEKTNQSETQIALPQLYLEQKLDRTVRNLTASIVGGIAYAKALNQTPEQYGTYIGKILAPGWEDFKGKGIKSFIEGLYKNFQADKNCQWEMLRESEKLVNIKMRRFGDATVKDYSETGVSIHEYDRCMAKIMQTITNYLGFYYESGSQDDWIIFWVSAEKKISR